MDIQTSAPYTSIVDPKNQHATWVEIDLVAIEANTRELVAISDAQLMAVVKANGYGHGAVETARAAARGGATWFGVARPEEALELRGSEIKEPILVLSPVPKDSLDELIRQDISITIGDRDQINAAASAAQSQGLKAKLHLELDTGMSRIGARPEEAVLLAGELRDLDSVSFDGIFTHFARADEPDAQSAREQLERFNGALAELEAAGLRPPLAHAANSSATLMLPEAQLNMVRVGIALYGLQPSKDQPLPAEFRPALQWKSRLTRVRDLPAGTGVSYGHDYVTKTEERIGTFPVGYADGLRRMGGNQVLVGSQQVPVVGRICMDLSMMQLEPVPGAEVGDEVVLIGSQGDETITAEQVADRWDTLNYEVTCGISQRVPRLFGYPDSLK
jgi:alanine racemase